MHYFYDPVYGSYTYTITAPKERPQISIFIVKLYIGHASRCMYMVLNNIQLNTIICVATYITDHILVIIDQQRHDYHGRLHSEMAYSA